jgi:hypothetical protein
VDLGTSAAHEGYSHKQARRRAPLHRRAVAFVPKRGESDIPKDGLDMKTAAIRIHGLAKSLGITKSRVVGNDIGLMVAYAPHVRPCTPSPRLPSRTEISESTSRESKTRRSNVCLQHSPNEDGASKSVWEHNEENRLGDSPAVNALCPRFIMSAQTPKQGGSLWRVGVQP